MSEALRFSGDFFSALGWALFHFLWQGVLVAAALAASDAALRKKSPNVRYALACAALATMLALPAVTLWSHLSGAASSSALPSVTSGPVAPASGLAGFAAAAAETNAPGLRTWQDRVEAARPYALTVWFAGVLVLSLRFLGGLAAARRLTRRGIRPAPAAWQSAADRLAARLSLRRPVRLLESAIATVPAAVGAIRPAILLPASVFTGLPVRGLEAILAHELAHVRRHDYLVNLAQTVAETLLFYHPAVWWVSSRVRAEREQCCDDLAIQATGDARVYARALVTLEEMRGAAPALAVAAGGGNLWNRIVRLVAEPPVIERPAGWIGGAIALSTLFLLGAAARIGPGGMSELELGSGSRAGSAAVADAVVTPRKTVAELRRGVLRADADSEPRSRPEPEPAAKADPEPDPDPEGGSDEPQKDDARRAVLDDDDLQSFRTHGVTPEFVRAIAALGYERADPDDLVALRIHGATPESIREMNAIFGKRPLDEHVALKIHGVTAESVRRLSTLLSGQRLSADDALAMKIHGIDAGWVERLRAAGYSRLSADDLVAAKIHGVDPDAAREWEALGYGRPSLEDLVAARIHGATPAFARELKATGLEWMSLDDVVAFRIHGVDANYVRELKGAGIARLSADDAVAMRIHGVPTSFVREIRSLGYTAPTADDLVALKVHGITVEEIRRENAKAGRRIPLDEFGDGDDHYDERDDDDEN